MLKPSENTFPASSLKTITAGPSELIPRPRALYIDTDGTMDIVNGDGTVETGIHIVAGTTISVQIVKLTATTGVVMGYYDDPKYVKYEE